MWPLLQVDLVDNGGDVLVTNSNREEYVRLYTQHLLEKSIHRQFSAFKRGFLKMCESPALALFRYVSMRRGLAHER